MLDKSSVSSTINNLSADEIKRFDAMAEQWWDPNGKYKTALAFNRARLSFIQAEIARHFNSPSSLTVLDVGSGGGLISESLAYEGYQVTGVDPSAVSVEVARRHALQSGVDVTYLHGLASDIDATSKKFDVVINAEVVEHVPDQRALIEQCCDLVTPGGLLILATLNRTVKSWLVAIVGAEYVLRYLPVGTHSWSKFVKPSELNLWATNTGCTLLNTTGMALNPLTGNWRQTADLSVNYVQSFSKQ